MLKIITLAVVLLTVVLLHSGAGHPVRRRAADFVQAATTAKPKLIRVQLRKAYSAKVDDFDVSRSKREALAEDVEFFGGHRSPMMMPPQTREGQRKTEAEPSEDFFRSDVKGFEARELEERLAEIGDAAEDAGAEPTDGRALTDDENQRFDVETSSKMSRLEEIEAFFDRRECGRNQ